MSQMPAAVSIRAVGPRDGLQSVHATMPTQAKLRWIDALHASGLREIEAASFVPPRLLPQMADAVRLPVIAAGGIMDGRGIAAALTLGASAVQLGTAFLRSPEAAIHPAWAEAIAQTAPEDTVLTRGFSGRLGRGIRNRVTEAFAGDLAPAPYPVQRALMTKVRAAAEAAKDASRMQTWAGQGAALSRAEPADALVRRLWADAEALLP